MTTIATLRAHRLRLGLRADCAATHRLASPATDYQGREYPFAFVRLGRGPEGPRWHIYAYSPAYYEGLSMRYLSMIERSSRRPRGYNAKVPVGWPTKKAATAALARIASEI